MSTITLAMIVKNEEAVLARCLTCVQAIVDEIIIVDTGSDDDTITIAKQFTDQVHSYEWHDDFAAARNYAFGFAHMDYIMWLDSDDVIDEANQKKLLALKKALHGEPDMVMMKYHTAFDDMGKPLFTYYRERLMKRSMHFQWLGAIHESITPQGVVQYVDIAIEHRKVKPSDPDRNLNIFENMIKKGITFSLRERYYYARELYYHKRYEGAIQQFNIVIDDEQTWIENRIDACRLRSICERMLHHEQAALHSLLESLSFDRPRAEIACDIGFIFYEKAMYQVAIYWYLQALQCEKNETSGAFILADCYDFIPYVQLAVCYDRIKEHELALSYHQKAAALKPNDAVVLKNATYFQQFQAKL